MPKIGANFQFVSAEPNFERDVVATVADLKAVKLTDLDRGHIVFCKANGKRYVFNEDGKNTVSATLGYFSEYHCIKKQVKKQLVNGTWTDVTS